MRQESNVRRHASHSQLRDTFRTDLPTVPGRPAARPPCGEAPRCRTARGIKREVMLLVTPAMPTGSRTRPLALFVLGMHRSGTSLLTRVLSLCGGTLPPALVGPDAGNPLGHWEPRVAMDMNDAILYRHHSHVYDPSLRLHQEGAFDAEEEAACITEIGAFLATLPSAPVIIIKEPRITLLSDIWVDAAHQAGFDVAAVIAVRHPQEVEASLAERDGTSPELSSALWLKYNLLAERHTRSLPRVFIDYNNLLDNWRQEIARISAAIAIDLDAPDAAAVDDYIRQDLRHQQHRGPVTNLFGTDWISTVYAALLAAARDEPLDDSAMDRVLKDYRVSEHDFRMAFDNFHNRFDGQLFRSVFRPSVTRKLRVVHSFATRLGLTSYWLRHHGKATNRRLKLGSISLRAQNKSHDSPESSRTAENP